MTADQFLSALINIEFEIESTRSARTFIIASNAVDAVTSRVINQGVNYQGGPFPGYSTTNVPYYLFFTRPGEKKNTTRSDQTKAVKDFVKQYGEQTNYENWRKFHGLPTEYKNFSFTNEMWKSITIELIDEGPDETVWGATSSDAQNLAVLLKHQEENDIMLLSDQEIDIVLAANQNRIASIIEKELDQYD